MFAGGEVVFGCIDEGNPEIKHQIEEQWAGVLCEEHLGEGAGVGGQNGKNLVQLQCF